MENGIFKFRVQNLSFGWCRILMQINDKEINYNASYIGYNPLASFIEVCADLIEEEEGDYHLTWQSEPCLMKIDMNLDNSNMLHFDIFDQDESGETIYNEWHETVPFDSVVSAITTEGFRVLNAFGLYGYRRSWQNHEDFPLTSLLRIMGECKELWKGDSCCTDISKEIGVLQNHISQLNIIKEKKMDECTLYYESWQIQCCGEPFSVGDKVDWTCIIPHGDKNAHGIIIDFEENHHGFASHSITGTVTKILAERSVFPKGKRVVHYAKAMTTLDELQHADGWESDFEDDDATEREFWGYIVELKDVTVKPLHKSK